MNTMNTIMLMAMMMFTSATARVINAPPSPCLDVATFVKSCDTMKISFLMYKENVAYCSRMDWTGITAAYSTDMPVDQHPSVYVSDTIEYLNISLSYYDTYLVLQNPDIITDDRIEYVDTLKNAIKNNTDPKSYCRRIESTGGGNVYKLKVGSTDFKICETNIIPSSPPLSPPSPPSPPARW